MVLIVSLMFWPTFIWYTSPYTSIYIWYTYIMYIHIYVQVIVSYSRINNATENVLIKPDELTRIYVSCLIFLPLFVFLLKKSLWNELFILYIGTYNTRILAVIHRFHTTTTAAVAVYLNAFVRECIICIYTKLYTYYNITHTSST